MTTREEFDAAEARIEELDAAAEARWQAEKKHAFDEFKEKHAFGGFKAGKHAFLREPNINPPTLRYPRAGRPTAEMREQLERLKAEVLVISREQFVRLLELGLIDETGKVLGYPPRK